MKKYFVLKQIGNFEATVARSFKEQEQAETFAELLRVSEKNEHVKYFVCETM